MFCGVALLLCVHISSQVSFELLISKFLFVIFVIPLLFRLLGIFWKCARIGKPMTAPYSFFFFYHIVVRTCIQKCFPTKPKHCIISFLQVSGRVPGWPAAVSSWLLVYCSYSSNLKKTNNGNIGEMERQEDMDRMILEAQ